MPLYSVELKTTNTSCRWIQLIFLIRVECWIWFVLLFSDYKRKIEEDKHKREIAACFVKRQFACFLLQSVFRINKNNNTNTTPGSLLVTGTKLLSWSFSSWGKEITLYMTLILMISTNIAKCLCFLFIVLSENRAHC